MQNNDIDFELFKGTSEPSNIIDEFTNEINIISPQIKHKAEIQQVLEHHSVANITTFTDTITKDKISQERDKLSNTNEYIEKANKIGKASLDTSLKKQELIIADSDIDNAIHEHEIKIAKHKLDIAAKHEYKQIDYEKQIERKISARENKAKNKTSKLIKYEELKSVCNLKTENIIVLAIISFFVALGDLFKGMSFTFKSFNGFLKSLIVVVIIISVILILWYGFDLRRFIKIGI